MDEITAPCPEWTAGLYAYKDLQEGNFVLAVQSGKRCVCRLSPEEKIDAEDIANALLLESAPKLLQSLRDMVALAESLDNKRIQPSHSPFTRAAKRLIASLPPAVQIPADLTDVFVRECL